MATGELIVAPRDSDVVANDFMPVLSVAKAIERKEMMNEFISKVLKEDDGSGRGDYGTIPGTKKPTLYKPGAEKLCSIFGLTPQYTADSIIEDWTGKDHDGEPMFYYAYRCSLSRGGRFMGEAIGSCSSWESKYRHKWVRADQLPAGMDPTGLIGKGGKQTLFAYDFAIEKAETTGDFAKPPEYWEMFRKAIADGSATKVQRKSKTGKTNWGYELVADTTLFRIPNPDVADCVNTVQKMAQKRALLAAVLIVTNASDAFTQDLEDAPEYERERAATVPRQEGSGSISSGGELFDNDEDPEPDPDKKAPPPAPKSKSAHEAQRAAAQAQFQASQASQAAGLSATPILDGRPIPEDLTVVFKRIDEGNRESVLNAFHLMEQSFKDTGIAAAGQEYNDIYAQFSNRFRAGKKAGPLDIKICLLDMWDSLKRWEKWKEDNRGGI